MKIRSIKARKQHGLLHRAVGRRDVRWYQDQWNRHMRSALFYMDTGITVLGVDLGRPDGDQTCVVDWRLLRSPDGADALAYGAAAFSRAPPDAPPQSAPPAG